MAGMAQAPEDAGMVGRRRRWLARGDVFALWAGYAELAAAAVFVSGSLCVSLYTIVTRALMVPTSEWVLHLPLELVTLASLFGAGGLIASEGHIGVDFVVDSLPRRVGVAVRVAVSVFLGAVCLFLGAMGIVVTGQAAAIHLTIPEIFDLPVAIPTGVNTAAIFLWALHFGWLAVRHWAEALPEATASVPDQGT